MNMKTGIVPAKPKSLSRQEAIDWVVQFKARLETLKNSVERLKKTLSLNLVGLTFLDSETGDLFNALEAIRGHGRSLQRNFPKEQRKDFESFIGPVSDCTKKVQEIRRRMLPQIEALARIDQDLTEALRNMAKSWPG